MSTPGPTIAVLDYGMGNLRSVEKALEHVGAEARVGADAELLRSSDGLILPGVGAFPEAMRRIRASGLDELIGEQLERSTPLLGICLGMQLLFDGSTENGGAEGLGLLAGSVGRLEADELKLPHIGWSPVEIGRSSPLTEGVTGGEPFYFVHSLVARPTAPGQVLATALHGERFAAAVGDGHVFGTQFHPEKSSVAGLALLRNFVAIAAVAHTPA